MMCVEFRQPRLRTSRFSPSPACGRRWPIGRMRVWGSRSRALIGGRRNGTLHTLTVRSRADLNSCGPLRAASPTETSWLDVQQDQGCPRTPSSALRAPSPAGGRRGKLVEARHSSVENSESSQRASAFLPNALHAFAAIHRFSPDSSAAGGRGGKSASKGEGNPFPELRKVAH